MMNELPDIDLIAVRYLHVLRHRRHNAKAGQQAAAKPVIV
jgi:hypothetical protein